MKKILNIGKGLQSLIPTKAHKVEPKEDKRDSIFYIEVNKIKPNPNQPRRDFDANGINELAQSIRRFGILQPLLVSKNELETPSGLDVEYYLIAGERRLQASRIAGLRVVPVIIKDEPPLEARDSLEMALIENIQRKDLNPIEEAEAFAKLKNEFHLTFEDIASRVGRSPQAVNNAVRLLSLPDYIKDAVRKEKLSMGHARALLAVKDSAKQKEAYAQVISYGASVRDIETYARTKGGAAVKRRNTEKEKRFQDLEKNLGEKLKTSVTIHLEDGAKGKVVARFSTHQQLNEIAKTILD